MSLLIDAITQKKPPQEIETLIKNFKPFSETDPTTGKTALMLIAESPNDQANLAKLLINRGAYINEKDKFICKTDKDPNGGYSALHYASIKGNYETAKLLLESGANPNQFDNNDSTPIMHSAQNGHLNITKLLVEKGAHIKLKSKLKNQTALHFVAQKDGNIEVAKYLHEEGADINQQNSDNNTPLLIALSNNHISLAKYLIEQGAKINIKNTAGESAIFYASKNGLHEIVSSLIFKGAFCNIETTSGWTPLTIALNNIHPETVKILLEQNEIDVNYANQAGTTPLMHTVQKVSLELAQLLIKKGAKIDAQCNHGMTALMLAIEYNDNEIARYLVEQNANLDKMTHNLQLTALHIATKKNNYPITQLLLKKGANRTLKNTQGKTAEDLAETDEMKHLYNSTTPLTSLTTFFITQFQTYAKNPTTQTKPRFEHLQPQIAKNPEYATIPIEQQKKLYKAIKHTQII